MQLKRRTYRIGDKYRICGGSGIESDKIITILPRSAVKTDYQCIPIFEGAYKPVNWKTEVAILLPSGEIRTMFKSRLIRIDENNNAI